MKGLKGIILGVLLAASVLMPFNIYAETNYPSISYNSTSLNTEWVNMGGNISNYCDDALTTGSPCKLTFTFNDHYYGFVQFRGGFGTSYRNNLTVSVVDGVGEYNYNTITSSPYYMTNVRIDYINLFIPDPNVDLDTIIQLMTQIFNEMQQSNTYLGELVSMRDYSFPIESYPALIYCFDNLVESDLVNFEYYTYPIFLTDSSKYMIRRSVGSGVSQICIWAIYNSQAVNTSTISDYYSFNVNYSCDSVTSIMTSLGFRINKAVFTNNSNSNQNINLTYKTDGVKFFPIYNNAVSNSYYVSTDFGLIFGLNNDLLNNLNIIANGTSGSQSAASDLEDNNDQMADDMDDLATIENGYNQDFNNQLQNIDFTNPITSNQGILPAANFVISVFNGLINNNPFSLLIIVCCILLIGKKVIGK